MNWLTGIVVYILVWWVTLFAVLPLWITPSRPGEPGHDAGAPQRPRLLLKAALTTAIAAVIWLAIFVLVKEPWFSFRES
jgi:predicted secreted protein